MYSGKRFFGVSAMGVSVLSILALASCAGQDEEVRQYSVQEIGSFPFSGRKDYSAVLADDSVLIWGGAPLSERGDYSRNAQYSISDESWSTIPEVDLEERTRHSSAWTGKEMIIWGGESFSEESSDRYFSDGAIYEPSSREWRAMKDAPAGVGSAVSGANSDYFVVAGGMSQDAEYEVYIYSIENDDWRRVEFPSSVVDIEVLPDDRAVALYMEQEGSIGMVEIDLVGGTAANVVSYHHPGGGNYFVGMEVTSEEIYIAAGDGEETSVSVLGHDLSERRNIEIEEEGFYPPVDLAQYPINSGDMWVSSDGNLVSASSRGVSYFDSQEEDVVFVEGGSISGYCMTGGESIYRDGNLLSFGCQGDASRISF